MKSFEYWFSQQKPQETLVEFKCVPSILKDSCSRIARNSSYGKISAFKPDEYYNEDLFKGLSRKAYFQHFIDEWINTGNSVFKDVIPRAISHGRVMINNKEIGTIIEPIKFDFKGEL